MKIVQKIAVIICISSLFSFTLAGSNVSNVATTAAPFLEIGVGARAVAMGGAFVATANDASAMYWNPAGLGNLTRLEAMFVHTEWLAGMSYDFAGIIFPLQQFGTLGLQITSLRTDDMKVRTIDRPDGTGEMFDAADLSLGLSYGIQLTNRFSIGFNLKYISQRIWKEKSTGFAVDIGTLYHTPITGLRVGASLSNFGTEMRMQGDDLLVYHDIDKSQDGNNDRIFAELKTDSWPLPLLFQFGVAYDLIREEMHHLSVEVDALHPADNIESLHAGVEYIMMKNYFLRAGYRNLFLNNSEEGLTLGAGIILPVNNQFHIALDYAYAQFGRLDNIQRFTVDFKF